MTSAVLTTTKGEVLHGGSPKAKLSTLKAEVLHGGAVSTRLTALKAEVIYSNTIGAPPRRVAVVFRVG